MNVTPQISDANKRAAQCAPEHIARRRQRCRPNPSLGALRRGRRGQPGCGSITSNIPVIQTREMESLIKVNSGQIAVMGGLIRTGERSGRQRARRKRLAGYGGFSVQKQENTKTELVVFMRRSSSAMPASKATTAATALSCRTRIHGCANPGKPPLLGDPQGTPR